MAVDSPFPTFHFRLSTSLRIDYSSDETLQYIGHYVASLRCQSNDPRGPGSRDFSHSAMMTIHKFDTVGSTNDIALDMARKGAPEGSVVLARGQLAGRGRRGRLWWDEPGSCVLMSAGRRPASLEQISRLSMVASLAVAQGLRDKCRVEALVKWPNDVMAGDRKIAGILVETAQTSRGVAAVVGIGVNVKQTAFPEEISTNATSVAIERGECPEVPELASDLAEYFFSNYN